MSQPKTAPAATPPFSLGHFVGGQVVAGTSGRTGVVYNPASGAVRGTVAYASADETRAAIARAAQALPGWAATPPLQRARVMFRFKALLEQHLDELAGLLTAEHGKVLSDARGEVIRGMEVVEFACGIPQLLKGEFSENVGTAVDSWSTRQPVGVCAGITPFNFPAMVPMWMFPVAIACGNTFVLKPSEKDPSCPLRVAELLKQAGLPDGVFNVINGDREAVDVLLTDPQVGAVSFVGSTPVAEYIYRTASAAGKRVQALGGAKNHMVVMPDADMDQAADALVGAGYGAAGERCMAVSVAVPVGDATAEALIERLVPRIEKLKVGPYTAGSDVDYGPVVTRAAKDNILRLVESGIGQGAELVVDGRDFSLQGYENGFFLGGCLFDRVTPEMEIYRTEIFGPVLSMVRRPSYEDALRLVMDNEYGNGTAIFTRDGDTARDFAHRCNIGMVGVNVPIPVPLAYHTFGGWKQSGFGDLNQHGPDAFRFYTRTKTVTSRWPSGIREGGEFHFRAID